MNGGAAGQRLMKPLPGSSAILYLIPHGAGAVRTFIHTGTPFSPYGINLLHLLFCQYCCHLPMGLITYGLHLISHGLPDIPVLVPVFIKDSAPLFNALPDNGL